MKHKIRIAAPDDVLPALDLALRVFIEFEAPDYEQGALEKFKSDCIKNNEYIENYISGKHLMFIALDTYNNIIGIVNERGDGRISMMFVDGKYHRQGIATALMQRIVCELKFRGINKITLHSSPYGLPFYKNFGFITTGAEQKLSSFIVTPMEYTPNEVWDVYDADGKKTGRFHERGRKMTTGDYHIVVHVWKRNSKGEWLLDRRSPEKNGTWETTGGCVIAGEDSLTGAIRETKEELGIDLDPNKGILYHREARISDDGHTWFEDIWVFDYDEPVESLAFDGSEVCDAMWATTEQVREMVDLPYFEEMAKKYSRHVL